MGQVVVVRPLGQHAQRRGPLGSHRVVVRAQGGDELLHWVKGMAYTAYSGRGPAKLSASLNLVHRNIRTIAASSSFQVFDG